MEVDEPLLKQLVKHLCPLAPIGDERLQDHPESGVHQFTQRAGDSK